jgi:hypothetical protein
MDACANRDCTSYNTKAVRKKIPRFGRNGRRDPSDLRLFDPTDWACIGALALGRSGPNTICGSCRLKVKRWADNPANSPDANYRADRVVVPVCAPVADQSTFNSPSIRPPDLTPKATPTRVPAPRTAPGLFLPDAPTGTADRPKHSRSRGITPKRLSMDTPGSAAPDRGRMFIISQADLEQLMGDNPCQHCLSDGSQGVFRHLEPKALQGGGIQLMYEPCTGCGRSFEAAYANELTGPVDGLTVNTLSMLLSQVTTGGITFAESESLFRNMGAMPFTKRTYSGMINLFSPLGYRVLNDRRRESSVSSGPAYCRRMGGVLHERQRKPLRPPRSLAAEG